MCRWSSHVLVQEVGLVEEEDGVNAIAAEVFDVAEDGGVCRRDRVYLTTNRTASEMFAAMCPARRVSVYLVEPVGELEHDPDVDEPGPSFQAAKGRILREFPMIEARRSWFITATMADP